MINVNKSQIKKQNKHHDKYKVHCSPSSLKADIIDKFYVTFNYIWHVFCDKEYRLTKNDCLKVNHS